MTKALNRSQQERIHGLFKELLHLMRNSGLGLSRTLNDIHSNQT